MAYKPIEDYAIIGNMRTAALISRCGSIDWMCYPHFDSPSLFAAILDDRIGGRFSIDPVCEGFTPKQFYWPDTNVLITRFLSEDGVGQIEDFMPLGGTAVPEQHRLVRRVRVARGAMRFRLRCEPAFDYARAPAHVVAVDRGIVFEGPGIRMGLSSSVRLRPDGRAAVSEFELEAGDEAIFTLYGMSDTRPVPCPDARESEALFEETVRFWRTWLSQCRYAGRWREVVYRSALTLKLLTFEPTGAIVAAPTTSLPEAIGGTRNWDYRYTWIRDAAFTLYGLLRLGFTSEADAFVRWLDDRYAHAATRHKDQGPLQIVYGLHGETELPEETLPHLEGYRGSGPVRIGNGAYRQLQLDIYGEMMDAVYLSDKYGTPVAFGQWRQLRSILDWVCENWHRPDEGIWEVRGERQNFVYSKLMCWVALDRGLRLASKRSYPADEPRWLTTRNRIYEDIMAKGWNEDRQAFRQSYESTHLDASNLIMPLVLFIAPSDPRILSTIDATNRPPRASGLVTDGLVYRYDTRENIDGIDGHEGTFNMCTFWLVEALTRAGRFEPRQLEDARLLFERMLGYANHVGLYGEETGHSGEALGNFPQAFTHLALISAAYNLDRYL